MMAQSVQVCSFSETARDGVSGDMAVLEVAGAAVGGVLEGGGVGRLWVEENGRS